MFTRRWLVDIAQPYQSGVNKIVGGLYAYFESESK